ncbi:MAG: acetyl-CoA carboxylase biotin carboxyl carrier protein subunit [Chlorobi bacterium]|nr:acetyl-CoA carboxylase biotin carboxyl carrier protein subunit [Chlorobiota bacterium]
MNGIPFDVNVKDERGLLLQRFGFAGSLNKQVGEIKAPMPGLITKVLVKPGDSVAAGQGVIVLEAMKMENELTAPTDGIVKAVHVTEREAVDKNAILIELE